MRSSIVVNGAARTLRPGTTVRGLLSELALERPGVAVAVNEEVVRRGDWDRTVLTRNDRVEIIHAVGGG
jgi:sulfur carrier protein